MQVFRFRLILVLALSRLPGALWAASAASPLPFCPPDWEVEVVAQPPQLIHPSVVCCAPDGRVFVAQDPIDMGLPSNSTGDSILCFHPDGRITTFAEHLHAIFGLCYLDGKVYVHHTPDFSVFTDHDGVGEDRRDLFHTNPNPNLNGKGFNDHIPSNLRLGMDGWFYMSTGDKGIFGAVGSDGSRAEIHGGGLLRFRPDGTQLEVYAMGTRNHLDVALNAEDEMFTYDNTDDGNGWWTRVTHMVDGGAYGYPFDYKPQRPYTLWMMTDFHNGSPTGALAYNEDALPEDYRGNLFLCEWGRRQLIRLRISREGATYKIDERVQTEQRDFATEGTKPFRPVGIAIAPDGLAFYIADWNYAGWRNKAIAGRLLKFSYTGQSYAKPKPAWWIPAASGQDFSATDAELLAALQHPAQNVRLVAQRRLAERGSRVVPALETLLSDSHAPAFARWHAIWTLDMIGNGEAARSAIVALATSEKEVSVRAQAIRQLGTRRVASAAPVLAPALRDPDPVIRFRAATALGRIGAPTVVHALTAALDEKDFFTRFAVFTALRRIGQADPRALTEIATGLGSETGAVRDGTRFALRELFVVENAAALAAFVASSAPPQSRADAFAILADLHHAPVPWDGKWWGTQPVLREAPAPKTVAWGGTPIVFSAIATALNDEALPLRRAAAAAAGIAGRQEMAAQLRDMFGRETDLELRKTILLTLGKLKDAAAGPLVASLLGPESEERPLFSEAIIAAGQIADSASVNALIKLAETKIDDEMLARIASALGSARASKAIPVLGRLLQHSAREVRAAAGNGLVTIGGPEARATVAALLDDARPAIRKSVIITAGSLKDKKLLPSLLALYRAGTDRNEAILALTKTPDLTALDVYLAGIGAKETPVRDGSRRAIDAINEQALPKIEALHRAKPFTGQALAQLQRVYNKSDAALAGPLFEGDSKPTSLADYAKFADRHPGDPEKGRRVFEGEAACISCHAVNGTGAQIGPDLTGVAAKYDRAFLIESVLYPSKQILDGYRTTTVTTKGGETFSGFLRSQTGEEIVLVDPAGEKHRVAKNEMAKTSELETSIMPEGLQSTMSLADFSNLVSYLESLKDAPISNREP